MLEKLAWGQPCCDTFRLILVSVLKCFSEQVHIPHSLKSKQWAIKSLPPTVVRFTSASGRVMLYYLNHATLWRLGLSSVGSCPSHVVGAVG